jgi:hypothetical protein
VIQSTSTPSSPHAKRRSISSSRAAVEYVIWRRWEDCLDFQRTLEVQYSAVSKRRRKGEPALNHHAKEGLYPSQRAASFESLPLGPDPSTIPVDVHAHIPRLSKKSSIFRINEAITQQRGEEFRAMIEALFDEDAPSTLQELRTIATVRDFFGYWRRDKEAERKTGKTPAFSSATQSPSYTGKGGETPKQSSVLTPELIAFATGGKITGPSKLKQPPSRRPSHITSSSRGSYESQYNPAYEGGRPTTSPWVHVVSPFSVSAAVTSGESQKRRSPSYRPAEGTRSPALLNPQSNMPALDSPRPSIQYTSTFTSSPYGDGFSYQPQQRYSPQLVATGSHPSLLAPYLPPGINTFTNSVPVLHPMQGRTASMPLQRQRRNGQMSSSPGTSDQVLPVPVPRRRNDAADVSSNRSARIFDESTGVVNGPPNLSEGERETNRGSRRRRSRSQVEVPLASVATPLHTEEQQSYGGSDTSNPSPVQTLLSTGYSTSITTPTSSHSSSMAARRHQTLPSLSSRRMSFDSLAPSDLGPASNDNGRPYVTQGPNPRRSMSSDSSHTDDWSSDAAPACPPYASMPSLIPPLNFQSSSALRPPGAAPPRPPRSALRASSIFSRAASSPVNSPLTPVEDGGPAVPVDVELPKRVSTNDDFVNSYLEMPSSAKSEDPFELEFRPQLPLTTTTIAHRARGIANDHDGTGRPMPPIVVPPPRQPDSDSIAPFSPSQVSPMSPAAATPLMGATTTIKAVHEASGTILLFRVPRMSTSLADLRKKLSRKFMDAENIKIIPEQFELRCLASASVVPNAVAVANNHNRPLPQLAGSGGSGAGFDGGVNSVHGPHGLWLPLNNEADWHMAAAQPSSKVTIKII